MFFQKELVWDNHQARGVPIKARQIEVTEASLRVKNNEAKSFSVI
tara:strand:- start:777 stop:911 length:135 start_codon:yes stop_codon:yes gene_type:complete